MKYLIFTMSLLTLVSCKDDKNQDLPRTTIEQAIEVPKALENSSKVYANAWTSEIQMNNGKKWLSNAETNEGVLKMQKSLKEQTSTLADYHKLATQLNEDKNFVIKNCTMKGSSHDNLHIWLLPLVDKINALSEAQTVEVASRLKQSIEENIKAYYTYFE